MDKKGTILVVDDEIGIRMSLTMILKDTHHVLLAKDGKEAVDLLGRHSVDLILLDIFLPDTDGIELLRQIRQMYPHVEIIMVTAAHDSRMTADAESMGAYAYIMKPFQVEDVLSLIQTALERRRIASGRQNPLP